MSTKKACLGIILALIVGAKEKKDDGLKNGSRSDTYFAMRIC
jgi:hypothetical protein